MLKGIGVTNAMAMGTAFVYRETNNATLPQTTQDTKAETKRLLCAIEESKTQIRAIIEKSDENTADILRAHINFLEDPSFCEEVPALIAQLHFSAEKAVQVKTDELYKDFLELDDEYMQERAADIQDVGKRILNTLQGNSSSLDDLPEHCIVIAHDLSPSQTAQMDRNKVKGFVTEIGGKTGHTAIMARAMQIAAVVSCPGILDLVQTGDVVTVDAVRGDVCIRPSVGDSANFITKMEEHIHHLKLINGKRNIKLQYNDGSPVLVTANIGSVEEAAVAFQNGADGIGLFRTEFLYMDRNEMPSEDEQYETYRKVTEIFGNHPVIIRTLDIGGDKSLPYLPMELEENPFLGVRAIRLCLKNQDLFRVQLRALLRAGIHGNLKIMFPMIGSLDELRQAKDILRQCKEALKNEGIPYRNDIAVGMMIEIPAAALQADAFAEEVDFFSIGTNDLIQYALAVDRGNPHISHLYDPRNPGVLYLIRHTIEAAHRKGIECGMCGEMAGDAAAIPILAQYGLDKYSVGIDSLSQTKVSLSMLDGITQATCSLNE